MEKVERNSWVNGADQKNCGKGMVRYNEEGGMMRHWAVKVRQLEAGHQHPAEWDRESGTGTLAIRAGTP